MMNSSYLWYKSFFKLCTTQTYMPSCLSVQSNFQCVLTGNIGFLHGVDSTPSFYTGETSVATLGSGQ